MSDERGRCCANYILCNDAAKYYHYVCDIVVLNILWLWRADEQ